MKITLLTTLAKLAENKRIEQEVKNLGHEFSMLDEQDFEFKIFDNKLISEGLTDIKTDVLIVRGIFNSIKSISSIIKVQQSKGIKVFDNNLVDHQYSIDKVTDIVKLSLAGIATPNTIYLRDFDKWSEAATNLGYPVIAKSTRMGKGASVFKINNQEQLDQLIENLVSEDKKPKSYILQEYIPYEFDLRVLIVGEHVWAMQRIPKEGEFRANFSLGGSVKLYDLDDDTRQLALKALSAVGMSVGGVDVLMTKDKARKVILEVNHTAGMIGMELATSQNITKIYVEHALANAC